LLTGYLVTPSFSGLSEAGLYQLNLTIAAGAGSGDVSLQASVGGYTTQRCFDFGSVKLEEASGGSGLQRRDPFALS
jgi:hypothetical protein